jgi:RimJ/RimL family protein N-acetyltransferase
VHIDRQSADSLLTERLHLRRLTPEDREPFARLNADSQVMEHFPAQLSPTEAAAFQQKIDAHFATRGFGFWAVSPRASSELLGMVGLGVVEFEAAFTPCIEVGWRLFPAHWGRGIAQEAAQACLDFAFARLQLEEVFAFTAVTNHRSQRLMQRLGMQPAGEFLHPALAGHALERHLLYRIRKPT